jgi:hypothetical protein
MAVAESTAKVQEVESIAARAWEKCHEIAESPHILDRLGVALASARLVAEAKVAKLVYLALTGRLFAQPISVVVKGPSAGGKSYLVKRLLKFFPASAYLMFTALSERYLIYMDEPLKHRTLVLCEAAGSGELADALMRCLLSDGRIDYGTVDEKRRGQKIQKEGPTGLLVTTTATELHPENETRLLSVTVTDTEEQTKNVLRALADEDRTEPDLSDWTSLQVWLEEEGPHEVTIPYGRELAENVAGTKSVRLRRDFEQVLALIRAHALLHRASRQVDVHERIVATLEDYAVVRELVAEIVSDRIGHTVRPTTRETVKAVEALSSSHTEGVPLRPLADALEIDRASASRRARVAIDHGYLRNLEDRPGRSARLVVGDAMPEAAEILPTPGNLTDPCTLAVDQRRGQASTNGHVPDAEIPFFGTRDGMSENGRV